MSSPQFNTLTARVCFETANQSQTPKASSDHAESSNVARVHCKLATRTHIRDERKRVCVQIISWPRYSPHGVCSNIGNDALLCLCIYVLTSSKVDYLIIHRGSAEHTHTLASCFDIKWLQKPKRLALAINWNCCLRLASQPAPLNHQRASRGTGNYRRRRLLRLSMHLYACAFYPCAESDTSTFCCKLRKADSTGTHCGPAHYKLTDGVCWNYYKSARTTVVWLNVYLFQAFPR